MKRKVILYFMIIIILTLSLVISVFGIALYKYYYQGIANTFENHVDAITPLWNKDSELRLGGLEDYSDVIIKTYQYKGAELQLLNLSGEIVQSSTGLYKENTFPIRENVLSFQSFYQKEELETSNEKVLGVYIPLLHEGHVVGVLRYISSLTDVHQLIQSLLLYGVLVSLGIAAVVFFISLRLADSIVKPFKEIIDFTEEMSRGRFEKRIEETYPHELGEMAQTLNYMADEIVQSDRLKNDFISKVSHELRTPLTGIKGWVEMMKSPEGLSEEETAFGLRMIDSESERLISLVEDLLDFSTYESERVSLVPSQFGFEQLLKDVSLQLRGKALEKNLQIILKSTPASIVADKDKIRQVLLNTVDNAIKFSKKDGVINIEQMISNHFIEVIIRDEGVGIKPEEISHIMDSFYKIDSKTIGVGLGLAISKKIIHQHGGTIEVQSEYGKGTTVIVRLPVSEQNIGGQDEKRTSGI